MLQNIDIMKKITIKKYYGLEYITVIGIPIKNTKHGNIIAINVSVIENLVARELIQKKVPIRGLEFKFLRKVLGLSLATIGSELGISAPAVLKWERAAKKRLDPINEVAVRALLAEKFGVKISGKFSELLGADTTPDSLVLNVKRAA